MTRAHTRRLGPKRSNSREYRALQVREAELAKARAPKPLAHRVSAAAMAAVLIGSDEIHYALPGGPRLRYDFSTGKTEPSDKGGDSMLYGNWSDE